MCFLRTVANTTRLIGDLTDLEHQLLPGLPVLGEVDAGEPSLADLLHDVVLLVEIQLGKKKRGDIFKYGGHEFSVTKFPKIDIRYLLFNASRLSVCLFRSIFSCRPFAFRKEKICPLHFSPSLDKQGRTGRPYPPML